MSVLIKNMEIPEHCGYCRFRYDGICHALQKTQYSAEECPLVSINDINASTTIEPQQWIPVTERLPEEKINENTSDFEYVLCTTTFGDVRPYKFGQPIGWSEPHFWHWNSMMDKYVVAWCELPEPWKGETDGLGR